MLKMNYEDIVERIIKESDVSREEIETKVKAKLKQLGDLISKEGAAHIIANELGIKLFDLEKKKFKIKDLFVGARNLEIAGRILQKYEVREFKSQRGEGKVLRFSIADDSGSIMVVVWDTKVIDSLANFDKDDVVKVVNAYVRDNNGVKELHLGKESGVEKSDEIIKDVVIDFSRERKKIRDLEEGDFVEVLGTVVQLFEPRFYDACPECNKKVEDGKCSVHGNVTIKEVPIVNFFFDDGTENIRVVAFRENAEKILKVNGESIKDKSFEDLKSDVLGSHLLLIV